MSQFPAGRKRFYNSGPQFPTGRKWAARLAGEADKTARWPGTPDTSMVRPLIGRVELPKRVATVSVFLTVGSALDDQGIAGRNSSIPHGSGG